MIARRDSLSTKIKANNTKTKTRACCVPAGGEEVRALVAEPGHGLVADPRHAAVQQRRLAQDRRHVA